MTERRKSGAYTQRELVAVLCETIDAAAAKGASAHRDIARAKLRTLLREENWNNSFILNNIGPTRCKHIAGLGQPVPWRWLSKAESFARYSPPKVQHDD